MAKQKADPLYTAPSIALGPLSIATDVLMGLAVEEFSQTGVTLTNERTKVTLPDPNTGVPVAYTLSLYISRQPLTDDERASVADTKATRTADKNARELKESDKLAREKRAAFELGQESTIGALRNIDALAGAMNTLRSIKKSA